MCGRHLLVHGAQRNGTPVPLTAPSRCSTASTGLVVRADVRRADHITLGALADSFYEYELKQYLLTRKSEDQFRRMCTKACPWSVAAAGCARLC